MIYTIYGDARDGSRGGERLNIVISNSGETPIYEQITGQIKNMVMSGQLKEGDALPSMRTLARELRISVITTKRAYEDLERDGFITTVVGKGSFVRKADTRLIREEKLKQIEKLLSEAVLEANRSGISKAELFEMLEIIYQEQ
jgi:GntR family transcriptional regulator